MGVGGEEEAVGVDVGDGPVTGGAGKGFFEAAAVAAEVVGE